MRRAIGGTVDPRTQVEATARYAHPARDPVRKFTVRGSDSIAAGIAGDYRPRDSGGSAFAPKP